MTKLIFSAVAVSLILSFSASITASGNKAGNEAKITRAPSDWPPYWKGLLLMIPDNVEAEIIANELAGKCSFSE